ncbi:MAG: TetR/AcrR family transcriptional regulator [Bilifractor sp.]
MKIEDNLIKKEILEQTIVLFNNEGLKFTMDELAARLHKSKKTIYTIFPDKRALLDDMVDYVFDGIKRSEQEAWEDSSLDTVSRLRKVLGAMPEQYQTVDFRKLYVLKDKYPEIYQHVQQRLENGWEQTMALLGQAMYEGKIRQISIPVFKTMFQATLEQFFQRNVLVENGIPYNQALQEVVNILMDGITIRS